MPLKDYYKILELQPGATATEVKKHFRKLALRFHPDTNQGNDFAAAWFRELQEAYDTLTDPASKEAYLQERWLCQSQGRSMVMPQIQTPDSLVADAQNLLNQVSDLDHFRMDYAQLADKLLQQLHEDRLQMLEQYRATHQQETIGRLLLKAAHPIPYSLLKPFFEKMKQLAFHLPNLMQAINAAENDKRRQYWWQKNQWWVMLLATLLLCGLMASYSQW